MNKIFYLILFIVLSMNIFAQNPITPNGKEVSATTYSYLTQNEIDYINDQIATNYPFVETIQSPQPYFGTFNCHFFAWHNYQGYTIWSSSANMWQNGTPPQYKWFNYPTDYFSDAGYSNPSGYASYIQTTESSSPIAVYKSGGTIKHSARRLSGSSELISKWGAWGVYKHSPTEVPAIYGSITEKYKINPNYRPVGIGDPGGRNWGTINNALADIPSNSAVKVYYGTYSENINLKPNIRLIGDNLPIINGTITLYNDDNVRIENLKVKNKILITNSDNVYLNIRSDHPNCYVEAVNSDIYFYDPYFFQTQSKAFYGHDNGHADFFKGSFRNKTSQGAYLHYWATAEFTESIFCSNVFDINATAMCYAAINNYGYFSSSQYRCNGSSKNGLFIEKNSV